MGSNHRGMSVLGAAVLFRVIQVALLPVGIVAYLWGIPKLLVYSRLPYRRFGIDNTPPARASAAEFVAAFGLNLEDHRNFGSETRRRQSPAGFVTATVGQAARP